MRRWFAILAGVALALGACAQGQSDDDDGADAAVDPADAADPPDAPVDAGDPPVDAEVADALLDAPSCVPALEVCNGLDDDCDPLTADGSQDPLLGAPCDGADGDLCAEGFQICGAAGLQCDDVTGDVLDLCNGADDDCDPTSLDGSEDPTIGAMCDGADGDLCAEGVRSCGGGVPSCGDTTGDLLDVCNGADDDCDLASADGAEDAQTGTACDGADGDLCAEGTRACTGGGFVCGDVTGDALDVCNGLDDDCDVTSIDGSEDPLAGSSCDGADGDLCAEGVLGCAGGLPSCGDITTTNAEPCNGVDDDCNPATPDGASEPWFGGACDGSDLDACNEGTFVCAASAQTCNDATGDSNRIVDGGYEASGASWTQTSTNFGTPLCDVAGCGVGGGTGPHGGAIWAWFGGIDAAETATASQVVVIPAGTATLSFFFEVPVCDATGGVDTLTVSIDGTTVFSSSNTDPACNVVGYVLKTVNVSAFANGGSHTLLFSGVSTADGTGVTNFFVDDVRLESCQ